ncbi:hypothetical protein ACXR0O_25450 [Verrucomicrobiota bacterium sgz303538]
MNPVDRVREVKATSSGPWSLEQLALAARDSLARWRDARSQLGRSFGFPPLGVVEELDPNFQLPADIVPTPDESPQVRWVILGFLAWETCPATANVPNPFEPLLAFHHHGGRLATEHGYLDIFAPNGDRCGIPMFPYRQ